MLRGDFTPSETVQASLAEYRNRSDNAAHFLGECCVFGLNESVGKQELYDHYRAFCNDWGHKSLSQTRFNARLEALHPEIKEQRLKLRKWKGVKYENKGLPQLKTRHSKLKNHDGFWQL